MDTEGLILQPASRSRWLLPGFFWRLALLASLLSAAPISAFCQQPTIYRDPQGRYTLQPPVAWSTAQLNADAVQFSLGPMYMTMLVLPSSDPDLMMSSIAAATGKQWKNFAEARRGSVNFGGRSGNYITYSGINPAGASAFLELLGVTDGSLTYLLMTSAPTISFTLQRVIFDQVQQSFTLSGVAKAPPMGLPPPPGGARETLAPEPIPASTARPASAAKSGTSTLATQDGHVYRMKLARIVDERGFERPMTALSLLIPADWQFQGSAQYAQQLGCNYNIVQLTFRATSPDGRLAIELLPGNTWTWADDPSTVNMLRMANQQMAQSNRRGCDIAPPMTAEDFLRKSVLPAVRRDARVTGAEPMPDALAALRNEAAETEKAAAQQGIRASIRTDASRVRVSYSLSGQPVEEWITAMTTSLAMVGPSFNLLRGVGQTNHYTNSADHVFGVRAPQGQLDGQDKFFQFVLGTVRTDPEWQARVNQAISTMASQDQQGAANRSAIITKSGEDTRRIIRETNQNSNAGREHSMQGWSQYMRGVQTYRNPNTGETVELSNRYEHAWAGPDNQYVVTDSTTYNPNTSQQGNWTRMEPVTR